jgi:hypothetical protein
MCGSPSGSPGLAVLFDGYEHDQLALFCLTLELVDQLLWARAVYYLPYGVDIK